MCIILFFSEIVYSNSFACNSNEENSYIEVELNSDSVTSIGYWYLLAFKFVTVITLVNVKASV